jgi:hypothetical protein
MKRKMLIIQGCTWHIKSYYDGKDEVELDGGVEGEATIGGVGTGAG